MEDTAPDNVFRMRSMPVPPPPTDTQPRPLSHLNVIGRSVGWVVGTWAVIGWLAVIMPRLVAWLGWLAVTGVSAGAGRDDRYTSFSRCCYCHFDSITVIIMEGTAPDNYTLR